MQVPLPCVGDQPRSAVLFAAAGLPSIRSVIVILAASAKGMTTSPVGGCFGVDCPVRFTSGEGRPAASSGFCLRTTTGAQLHQREHYSSLCLSSSCRHPTAVAASALTSNVVRRRLRQLHDRDGPRAACSA